MVLWRDLGTLWHMVLAIVAMVISVFATLTLLTKNSFLEQLQMQYVITARAKGLSEHRVLYGHVFRNAMLIVIAGFPSAFISIFFSSSLLIEVIFSLDGLGLPITRCSSHSKGSLLFPAFVTYPETRFGGEFTTAADYRDPYVVELIQQHGWMLWPLIPYSYDTVVYGRQAPAPPSRENWLGTDDHSRDVLARLIYGFRISVLFGLVLTMCSLVIGVSAGAIQGYFGGWLDLSFQRFMEIWGGMPTLYLLIILSSVVQPNFWWLLGILLLFSWMGYVGVVRAEFLRARNFDFVRAARALAVSNLVIMFRHVLPNAMVATITFFPFNVSGAITALTALDFLGFGLPPGSPSLGEMVTQGRNNLHAPWLGLSSFFTLGSVLILLIFTGEAVRDAFDPRKTFVARNQ